MKASGLKTGIMLASYDDRTCRGHNFNAYNAYDGRTYENCRAWRNKVVDLSKPMLPVVDSHPNCRCHLAVNRKELTGEFKERFKEKTYIKSPEDAPKGADVKEGSRGGLYYDGDGDSKIKQKDIIHYKDKGITIYQKDNYIVYDKPPTLVVKGQNLIPKYGGEAQISLKEAKDAINEAKNINIKSKINILNYNSEDGDTNGFMIPLIKDNMYIYMSKQDVSIEGLSEFYEENNKKSKAKIIKELTQKDLLLKTMMHEEGHLKTVKAFGNYMDNDFTFNDVKIEGFKEYISLMLEGWPYAGIDSYKIGEVIAEDYRVAKARKHKLPTRDMLNAHTYKYDIKNPEATRARQRMIFKILEAIK